MAPKVQKAREDAQKYYAVQKWDKALEAYTLLTKLEPTDPKHFQKAAELNIKLNRKKDAVAGYKLAVDKYMARGFLIQAIAICKIIIQMAPEEKEIEDRLSALYAKRGVMGGDNQATPGLRNGVSPRAAAPAPKPRPEVSPVPQQPPIQKARPKEDTIQLDGEEPSEMEFETTSAPPSPKAAPPAKPAAPTAKPTPPPTPKKRPAPEVINMEDDTLPEISDDVDAKDGKPAPVYELDMDMDDAPDIPIEQEATPVAQSQIPMEDAITLEEEAPGESEIQIEEEATPPSPRTSAPPEESIELEPDAETIEKETPVEVLNKSKVEAPSDGGIEIDVMGDESDEVVIETDLAEKSPVKAKTPSDKSAPIEIDMDMGDETTPVEKTPEEETIELEPDESKGAPVYDLSAEMESSSETVENLEIEWKDVKVAQKESPPEETPSDEALISDAEIEEATFFPEIPLFSDLSQDEFREVIRKLRSRSYKKGDFVIREGEKGDSIFIVASGRVEVYKQTKEGTQSVVGTLSEGEFFGEFGYFAGSKRQASVKAAEETELLEITREDMEFVVASYPGIEQVLDKFYRKRVVENLLATSVLFMKLDPSQRSKLASIFKLEEYREGSPVVKEGEEGDTMYIIRSGHVTVHTQNPMGEKVTLAELGPGEFFGEISLLSGKPRTATVSVSSPVVELMSLNKDQLDALIEQFPSIGETLKKVMDARAEDTVNKVSFLDLDEESLEIGSLI